MNELIRVRLDVTYDGTDFSGWAAQPQRRTVAGVLTEALGTLVGADTPLGLTVAGRTDAGVHATGQVCHIDLPAAAWDELDGTLVRRLAALMPPDARVRTATPVPDTFDARFSATFRRYEYRVADTRWGPEPLRRHDTLGWVRPLDLDRLRQAAAGLIGEHDYAAYCKRKEHGTTVRAITALDWRRQPDGVVVATVQADAFCQAMVRSLVGALLSVGDGRRDPEWPATLLTLRERASSVTVAPAHGLTLVAVGYPDDPAEYARRAEATRRLRA
ncbi:tRNA pseudouridine(38-40) synthase TruA [Krasilnikovia sp. M28-CT-15]|uniref:tRNA pseudouridine(38-40) synthase TruA n=1 Tax=Krasilnikovia sp. M28-CT-15 TaxID=3373540 RepID=UPI0038765DAF